MKRHFFRVAMLFIGIVMISAQPIQFALGEKAASGRCESSLSLSAPLQSVEVAGQDGPWRGEFKANVKACLDGSAIKKIPGIHKVGDVTLKRGVVSSDGQAVEEVIHYIVVGGQIEFDDNNGVAQIRLDLRNRDGRAIATVTPAPQGNGGDSSDQVWDIVDIDVEATYVFTAKTRIQINHATD